MKNLIFTLFLVLAFGLAGCSTLGLPGGDDFWSYNPQNKQGGTLVTYEGKDVHIDWSDFKDKSVVKVSMDLNSDGNMDFVYEASDVIGSTAAAIRAEVEKKFAEAGVEVAPEVVNGVVDAILGL